MELDTFLLAVFPLVMIIAAIEDITTMTLSNWLSLALVAAFAGLAVLLPLPPWQIALHLAAGFAVLGAGLIFFARGWIGGGDAKLVSAIALFVGCGDLLFYLLIASVVGGILTLALLFFRKLPLPAPVIAQGWVARLHDHQEGVPYGVALAAAGLIVFPDTPLFAAVAV